MTRCSPLPGILAVTFLKRSAALIIHLAVAERCEPCTNSSHPTIDPDGISQRRSARIKPVKGVRPKGATHHASCLFLKSERLSPLLAESSRQPRETVQQDSNVKSARNIHLKVNIASLRLQWSTRTRLITPPNSINLQNTAVIVLFYFLSH